MAVRAVTASAASTAATANRVGGSASERRVRSDSRIVASNASAAPARVAAGSARQCTAACFMATHAASLARLSVGPGAHRLASA